MRRWFAAAVCALSVFLLLPASQVAAHTTFVNSNLVDGSVLEQAPPTAELHFSEAILLSASSVRLLHLGTSVEDDLKLTTSQGDTVLIADLPALDNGPYILRFTVVDPADLHKTVGSISFGIGVAAPPSESGEQIDSSWITTTLNVLDQRVAAGRGRRRRHRHTAHPSQKERSRGGRPARLRVQHRPRDRLDRPAHLRRRHRGVRERSVGQLHPQQRSRPPRADRSVAGDRGLVDVRFAAPSRYLQRSSVRRADPGGARLPDW